VSQLRPRQRSAAQSAGDAWPAAMVTRPHRTVRCAKGVVAAMVGFTRKEGEIVHSSLSGGAPDCSVRPRTEGNYCLANAAPMTPSYLGAIKGTPRRMEQDTMQILNILRCLDSASTHSILCV
jgi:hypothetical protein